MSLYAVIATLDVDVISYNVLRLGAVSLTKIK